MKVNKFKRLTHPIRKELTWAKATFQHYPCEDFIKSQWQTQTSNIFYLIYRWIISIIFTTIVLITIIKLFMHGRYFIYLTHWGLMLCMITNVYGAILVTLWYWKPNFTSKNHSNENNTIDNNEQNLTLIPWSLKIYWALHMTTLNVALVITFIYWVFLYGLHPEANNDQKPPQDDNDKDFSTPGYLNYLEHALNSILMLIDLMIVAFPIRILHIIYPILFALIYVIFTVIYYFADGVDEFGNRYVYPILDWSKPEIAFGTIFGCFVLLILFGIFTFLIYKLRRIIYQKYHKKSEIPY